MTPTLFYCVDWHAIQRGSMILAAHEHRGGRRARATPAIGKTHYCVFPLQSTKNWSHDAKFRLSEIETWDRGFCGFGPENPGRKHQCQHADQIVVVRYLNSRSLLLPRRNRWTISRERGHFARIEYDHCLRLAGTAAAPPDLLDCNT